MERLIKIGKLQPINSKDITDSRMGLGMEKLDRDVFENDTYYRIENTLFYNLDNTIKASEQKYLSVSPNDLTHLDTCIYLHNKKNITIDFCGNTLLMEGRVQPIIIDECENITIKNCVAEFETSFATEFEIIEIGSDYTLLKTNKKQNCKVIDGCIVSFGKSWENNSLSEGINFLACFDKQGNPRGQILVVLGNNPKYDKNSMYVPTEYVAEQVGEYIKLKGPVVDEWRVGDLLVEESEPRVRYGIGIIDSKNITLENYRILNGLGVGIMAMHSENIFIKNCNMFYDERSHGVVSNSADAIHTFACSGELVIEDCLLESSIDDFINVHGNYLSVSKIIDDLTLECEMLGYSITAYCNMLDVGDKFAIHKGKTMLRKNFGLIKERQVLDDKKIIYTFETPINGIEEGDIIENLSGNAKLTIRNCKFKKSNAHIRLQTSEKILLENCCFDVPILLSGDLNFWFEGNPCSDLTIRNCEFNTIRAIVAIMPEFEDIPEASYYHQNIKIYNNIFENETALIGNRAKNIEFFGNKHKFNKKLVLDITNCDEVKSDI